ncbi:MAG: alpha/beta fold hydrolase [Gaiellaceae bacterium]
MIALAAPATALTLAAAGPRVSGPFGRGAAQVCIVGPAGRVRDVVVFGHGWKVAPPSVSYPWVGQFRPWLDHLAASGSAVIFPRYQFGGDDPQDASRVRAFDAGVRTAYVRLGRPAVPLVVAGYSFGASLAFYFAADAARLGLPVPRAVDAIFPAGTVAGARLGRLAPSTRFLLQVGDRDAVAGRGGADAFWVLLASRRLSHRRYEIVRSSSGLSADHTAPKQTNARARAAFWKPLDALISLARR